MPFLVTGSRFAKIEPTHNAMKWLLNIDNSPLSPISYPLILLTFWLVCQFCVIFTMWIIFCYVYMIFTFITFFWFTPVSIRKSQDALKPIVMVNTKVMVNLIEGNYITFLRTQQILNVIVNQVFGSVLVAAHHGAICFIFVLSTCLLVDQGPALREQFGYFITGRILMSVAIPITIQYYECNFLGKVYENAKIFLVSCSKLTKQNLEDFIS